MSTRLMLNRLLPIREMIMVCLAIGLFCSCSGYKWLRQGRAGSRSYIPPHQPYFTASVTPTMTVEDLCRFCRQTRIAWTSTNSPARNLYLDCQDPSRQALIPSWLMWRCVFPSAADTICVVCDPTAPSRESLFRGC